MPKKINLNELVMDLVLLIPITTLFQMYLPAINRICIAIIIILLIILKLKSRLHKQDVVAMVFFVFLYGWSVIVTNEVAYSINDYFYFLFFMLYASFIGSRQTFFLQYSKKRKGFMVGVVALWNVVVLISMFFSTSYQEGYFVSFTGNVFRLTPAATFILALLIVLVAQYKFAIVFAVIPMYSILASGSRTYFILGVIIFIILLYMIMPSKQLFVLSLIPILLIITVFVLKANITDRFIESLTVNENEYYQDSLIKFTSGRSLFWAADLNAFWKGPWIKKILGYGFNYVYDINERVIKSQIWAHNDFINIALNFGFVGIVYYICAYMKMFVRCTNHEGISLFLKLVIFFVWFFNANFNMFYTYTCASASYPFIAFGLVEFAKKKRAKQHREDGR